MTQIRQHIPQQGQEHVDPEPFKIESQPDGTSCGPTTLFSVYRHLGHDCTLDEVKDRIFQFDEGGGTLAVVLGIDALRQGLEAVMYSYNIHVFDPTWFDLDAQDLIGKLDQRQRERKNTKREKIALGYYKEFISLGGKVVFEDLSQKLLLRIFQQDVPFIAGLSSSWLYRSPREMPLTGKYDDIHGDPGGHFVVIHDYDADTRKVSVADPYKPNPISGTNYYSVRLSRLVTSLLLGISTFDGNMLIIRNKAGKDGK